MQFIKKFLAYYLAPLYCDRCVHKNKIVPCNCPDITLFEKTNKRVYLINVSIPNSDNMQIADTKKKREKIVAELYIEVKRQSQVEEVYTLPVTLSATGVISHILHDVFK